MLEILSENFQGFLCEIFCIFEYACFSYEGQWSYMVPSEILLYLVVFCSIHVPFVQP